MCLACLVNLCVNMFASSFPCAHYFAHHRWFDRLEANCALAFLCLGNETFLPSMLLIRRSKREGKPSKTLIFCLAPTSMKRWCLYRKCKTRTHWWNCYIMLYTYQILKTLHCLGRKCELTHSRRNPTSHTQPPSSSLPKTSSSKQVQCFLLWSLSIRVGFAWQPACHTLPAMKTLPEQWQT